MGRGILERFTRALFHKLRNRRTDPGSADIFDRANVIHPFDLTYDVDTSGLIWGEDLPTSHPTPFGPQPITASRPQSSTS